MMLTTSCHSVQFIKRRSTMWMMTWQVLCVRPQGEEFQALLAAEKQCMQAGASTRPLLKLT
jgi:hypothetical protein